MAESKAAWGSARSPLTDFVLRRTLGVIPVVMGTVLAVMLILDFIPGDPARLMLGELAPPAQVEELRHSLGLDKPLVLRYVQYFGQLLRGDLGRSIRSNRPVREEIGDAWPYTLLLALTSVGLAVLLGIVVGAISAWRPSGWLDAIVRVTALFGLSMPIFWIGLVFMYIFGFYLRLLPIGGVGTVWHVVLPTVTLALPSAAVIARMSRSSLLEVLGEDYIRTARAKGVRELIVMCRHALKNALIPVVTIVGLQFGSLVGGAVLTETVFAWPGLGRLTVQAISVRDYVFLQGAVLVFALSFLVVNLLVDLSYGWLDPRLRHGASLDS
jgi:peptide/nickel transport system permease protein/oligopeptide transport system permease protein